MSIFHRGQGAVGGAASAISFVWAFSTTGTSGTMPTTEDELNDFIIRTALRTADSTAVSIAAGEGWIDPTAANIVALQSGSGGAAGAMAYKIVDQVGAEAGSASWTGAQSIVTALYRGVNPASPILASGFALGAGDTVSWPALTYSNAAAWVVLTIRTFNSVTNVDPSSGLFTVRVSSARRALWDSGAPMASFAGASATFATPGQWITTATAIRP